MSPKKKKEPTEQEELESFIKAYSQFAGEVAQLKEEYKNATGKKRRELSSEYGAAKAILDKVSSEIVHKLKKHLDEDTEKGSPVNFTYYRVLFAARKILNSYD